MAKETRKGKPWVWILVSGLILGIIFLVLGIILLGLHWMSPVTLNPKQVTITIPRGTNTSQIAMQLKEVGLIRSAWAFRIYSRYRGLDTRIQAGQYTLDASFGLPVIVEKLLNNPNGISVVLLEGWRREQIAQAIEKSFGGQNPNFSKGEFLKLTEKMEGQLFPDTYQFELLATNEKIIQVLNNQYRKIVGSLIAQNQAREYSQNELVTIASLIEREAALDADRKEVAGVLFNRLEAGMPLQIDASLQYIRATRVCANTECDNWWPNPRAEDKDLVSPYNTYLVVGLPPMAISNPGKATLEAAYNPQKSDYFYYLTDSSGVTHYAKTYDEHVVNINRYLR